MLHWLIRDVTGVYLLAPSGLDTGSTGSLTWHGATRLHFVIAASGPGSSCRGDVPRYLERIKSTLRVRLPSTPIEFNPTGTLGTGITMAQVRELDIFLACATRLPHLTDTESTQCHLHRRDWLRKELCNQPHRRSQPCCGIPRCYALHEQFHLLRCIDRGKVVQAVGYPWLE